ncbi:hypothetical protein K402DRAFT_231913 [Aulographum hederae CBS 113979]|uniref:Uncharacterized protein n=1 Tax=Aulographum hederae CBS 113979 TaxID=1176131 RepID=A0A6G1GLF3_9PEZI|nr:hypothetical protein K402DRAFT_231913 [Aulographum hederae CBS 113979]
MNCPHSSNLLGPWVFTRRLLRPPSCTPSLKKRDAGRVAGIAWPGGCTMNAFSLIKRPVLDALEGTKTTLVKHAPRRRPALVTHEYQQRPDNGQLPESSLVGVPGPSTASIASTLSWPCTFKFFPLPFHATAKATTLLAHGWRRSTTGTPSLLHQGQGCRPVSRSS